MMHRALDALEVLEKLDSLPKQKVNWGMKAINADKAWEKYRGRKVKIGLIDSGIDFTHPDLEYNTRSVASFIDDTAVDSGFHGTHVAGIFGAGDTGFGVIGVAPEVEIYSAKIFNAEGRTTFTAEEQAIRWLISKDVDIINMSYGGFIPPDIPEAQEFLKTYHALIKEVDKAGIIMVAAAGNSGNPNDVLDRIIYPARFPEVIAVGALCEEQQRADFSSAGPDLDFAMPGVDVYSTYPGERWARFSGTSMATPYLAGCVALIKEWKPKATRQEVMEYLIQWSNDLGIDGTDPEFGWGLVNIGKILLEVVDGETEIKLDQPMTIVNNRTLAPLRFIVELNGGTILSWDNQTKTVVFRTTDDKRVTMQVDNPIVKVVKG